MALAGVRLGCRNELVAIVPDRFESTIAAKNPVRAHVHP